MTAPASAKSAGRTPIQAVRHAVDMTIRWLLALPLWAKIGLGGAIAAGLMGLFLFLGFMVNQHQVFPAKLFARVDGKLQKILPARAAPELSGIIRSTLIDLDLQSASLNTGRDTTDSNLLNESGGGLTSFGDDILLLAYDGQVYAGSSPAVFVKVVAARIHFMLRVFCARPVGRRRQLFGRARRRPTDLPRHHRFVRD